MSTSPNSRRSIVLLLALVCLFTVLGVWFSRREAASREDSLDWTPEDVARPRDLVRGELAESPALRTEDSARAAGTSTPAAAPAVPLPRGTPNVFGRVLDVTGAGVPNAVITLDVVGFGDAEELAVSGADGTFAFEARQRELRLIASATGLRTLRAQAWHADDPTPGLIVVAPCHDVRGIVVDEANVPIAGALVSCSIPPSALAGFPGSLERSPEAQRFSVSTNTEGRFVHPRAIDVSGARLQAQAEDYLEASIALPADDVEIGRIVLALDSAASGRVVTGIVLRANGQAAVNARVSLGKQAVLVGTLGEFRLRWPNTLQDEMPLVAVEAGSQAACVPDFGRVIRTTSGPLAAQRLVLGPAPLSIQGRVLDDRGAPVVNASVSLLDALVMANSDPIETLSSGRDAIVLTDEQGDFEIGGLFAREYRLQVHDAARMGRLETNPIPAGSIGVIVAYPADAIVAELRGRVVGHDDTPVAGARVFARSVVRTFHGSTTTKGFRFVETDEEGAFTLSDVPRRNSSLVVQGVGFLQVEHALEGIDPTRAVNITVDRYCPVRIEGLADTPKRRWIGALDSKGQELMLDLVSGTSRSGSNRLPFQDGPPGAFEVSESAVEFVLYDPYDTIAARRPVRLNPGRESVIPW